MGKGSLVYHQSNDLKQATYSFSPFFISAFYCSEILSTSFYCSGILLPSTNVYRSEAILNNRSTGKYPTLFYKNPKLNASLRLIPMNLLGPTENYSQVFSLWRYVGNYGLGLSLQHSSGQGSHNRSHARSRV